MSNFTRVIFITIISALISGVCIYALLTPTDVVELRAEPLTAVTQVHYYQTGPHMVYYNVSNIKSTVYRITKWYGTEFVSVPVSQDQHTEQSLLEKIKNGDGYYVPLQDAYDVFDDTMHNYNHTTKMQLLGFFKKLLNEK